MSRNVNVTITGQQLLAVFLILTGSILLLWFCWPLLFKGIINAGNVCGIMMSLSLLIYGIRWRMIHQIILRLWQKRPARIGLSICTAFLVIGTVLMIAAAVSILQAESKSIPENTPAVVLGCSVKGTRPSRILQERIDAACAYMQENPQAVCVLSGGQGKDEDISEAECMYQAMLQAGVDSGRLYRETKSADTQENLRYSKSILEKLGITGAVTVISNEFHLYRGRTWADALGYQSYGYAASTDWRYLPTFFLREMIAVVYLWLMHI